MENKYHFNYFTWVHIHDSYSLIFNGTTIFGQIFNLKFKNAQIISKKMETNYIHDLRLLSLQPFWVN